jgi:DNA-binding XRE family transcriptional regulator
MKASNKIICGWGWVQKLDGSELDDADVMDLSDGTFLCIARKVERLTQEQLGKLTGTRMQSILFMEHGISKISPSVWKWLLEVPLAKNLSNWKTKKQMYDDIRPKNTPPRCHQQ